MHQSRKLRVLATVASVLCVALLLKAVAADDRIPAKKALSEAEINKLVSQLAADEFAVREAAAKRLTEAGALAFAALDTAKKSGDPEVRLRAELIERQIVEKAVVHLEKLGVSFTGKRLAPHWLATTDREVTDDDLVQVGCLRSLTLLVLERASITDKGLRHVGRLKRIEHLSLRGCREVTDEGIRHLKGAQSLRHLALDGCNISDKSLAVAATCPNLRELFVSGRISDKGLAHLAALTQLEHIGFFDCEISGVGIAHLRPAAGTLRWFLFYDVPLQDGDLRALTHFQALQRVDISDAPITDAGVIHLKQLPKLSSLLLQGTKISDRAITHLKEIRQLRLLNLRNTSVTPQGLIPLRELGALRALVVPNTFSDRQIEELKRILSPDPEKRNISIRRG